MVVAVYRSINCIAVRGTYKYKGVIVGSIVSIFNHNAYQSLTALKRVSDQVLL